MVDFDPQALIGLFECIDDNNEKCSDLKEQIKMINADSKSRLEEFAKDYELSLADLKDGYKHYQKVHLDGESSEDLYEILAKIDEALEAEPEPTEERFK